MCSSFSYFTISLSRIRLLTLAKLLSAQEVYRVDSSSSDCSIERKKRYLCRGWFPLAAKSELDVASEILKWGIMSNMDLSSSEVLHSDAKNNSRRFVVASRIDNLLRLSFSDSAASHKRPTTMTGHLSNSCERRLRSCFLKTSLIT